MSRIEYGDDEDYSGQYELQYANQRRAIAGRKGQAVLRELEAALLEMPRPRLLAGAFVDDGEVCATGAVAVRRLMLAGKTREEALSEAEKMVHPHDGWMEAGDALGISRPLAWAIVEQNDEETSRLTPEGRHAAVLAWVRRQLKEHP